MPVNPYWGQARRGVSDFVSGLEVGKTLDQFGRKLAHDFVGHNAGAFGAYGGMAKLLAPYAQGYDRSTPNGQLAAWLVLGTSLVSPGGPAKNVGRVEDLAGAARATTRSAVGIGEHAGESIAARSAGRNFTTAERAEINRIGSQTGCHTCGTTNPGTKSGNFVPDHQPASALNVSGGPQRLYPQCINCSREQGLEIARQLSQGGQ
jgi:hypothetical protein